jgi:hypothetical protein
MVKERSVTREKTALKTVSVISPWKRSKRKPVYENKTTTCHFLITISDWQKSDRFISHLSQ